MKRTTKINLELILAAVMLISACNSQHQKEKTFSYQIYKVRGDKLTEIANTANLRKIGFEPGKVILGPVKLKTTAEKGDGSSVSTRKLIEEKETLKYPVELAYDSVKKNYVFDMASRAQIDFLLELVKKSEVNYFVFTPKNAGDFYPSLAGLLGYQITAFKADGTRVNVGGKDSSTRLNFQPQHNSISSYRAMVLIPCPPGSNDWQ